MCHLPENTTALHLCGNWPPKIRWVCLVAPCGPQRWQKGKGLSLGACLYPGSLDQNHRAGAATKESAVSSQQHVQPIPQVKTRWAGPPMSVCIWKCSRRSYLTLMMAETSVEQNWVSAVNETFFALHLFLFIYLTKIYGEPPISCIITSCIGVILLMINIWKEMLPYDKIRNQQLPVSQGSDCRGMGRGCDREDHTPHSSRCAL